MSQLKVLTRGYAMVQSVDGAVIRSVRQVREGQSVTVQFGDGRLEAAVTARKEQRHESAESDL